MSRPAAPRAVIVIALVRGDVRLVEQLHPELVDDGDPNAESVLDLPITTEKIDDPVRMYLTQMGEIPLLTRDEEISLYQKIEITR